MPRVQTKFVCQQCGAESVRWFGRCSDCGAYGSLVEERATPAAGARPHRAVGAATPLALEAITEDTEDRRRTAIGEFDRVLGGGVVAGSVTLVAGDPGIGKSTLLLQAAAAFAANHGPVLYVSGEESLRQVKMRARRLGLGAVPLAVLAETDIGAVLAAIETEAPTMVVVDSIQTMQDSELESVAGSVGQVRQCAGRLLAAAKGSGLPVMLVGHVTKEGAIAGPRLLEHMVDTVLYLEGDRHLSYRLLRAVKNRFGSTNELGIFEMVDEGMAEVPNPSQVFLSERRGQVSGSAVVAVMEGSRPLLVEVQALVARAAPFGTPRRAVSGVEHNRTCLLLAVLEKRERLDLAAQDVYVNLPGGVRITEPAADLGIALAVASSLRDQPVREDTVFFGEVGLTGEVRAVGHLERRIEEAARLGFGRAVVPRHGLAARSRPLEVVAVDHLSGAFAAGFCPPGARVSSSEERG